MMDNMERFISIGGADKAWGVSITTPRRWDFAQSAQIFVSARPQNAMMG